MKVLASFSKSIFIRLLVLQACFALVFLAPAIAQAANFIGTVKDPSGTPISGVTIKLRINGALQPTTTTNSSGVYAISGGVNGDNYRITPSKSGYIFDPTYANGVIGSTNITENFLGSTSDLCPNDPNKIAPGLCGCGREDYDVNSDNICDLDQRFTLSGTVKTANGTPISGVTINAIINDVFEDGQEFYISTTTNSSGAYTFTDRSPGELYLVSPKKAGYSFAPVTVAGEVLGNEIENFVGTVTAVDNCPNDPNKTQPGLCGCGIKDYDNNSDGICDYNQRYTVSGKVTNSATGGGIAGATVSISIVDVYYDQQGIRRTTTDSSGNYSFPDLIPGMNYLINSTLSGYTFDPSGYQGSITSSNITHNFVGTAAIVDNCPSDPNKTEPGLCGCGKTDVDVDSNGVCDLNQTFTISGTVETSNGTGISGIEVTYSGGGQFLTFNTTSSGAFSFPNRPHGETFLLIVSGSGYTFSPVQASGTVLNNLAIEFVGTPLTHTISGTVKTASGTGISGVTMTYSAGGVSATATTTSSGAYSFTNRTQGESYTITPTKSQYTFSPSSSSGTVTGSATKNFFGTINTYQLGGVVKTLGGFGISGVVVKYTAGGTSYTVTTPASGSYSFERPYGESYTLTATKSGYTFDPASHSGTMTQSVSKLFTGIPDVTDLCPDDLNKTEPGLCGCGFEDIDADQDFVCDSNGDDQCPNDFYKTVPGTCGCGNYESDVNNDGICDANQTFTVSGTVKDTSGNPLPGASVKLYTQDIYNYQNNAPNFTTSTNATGSYSFPNTVNPGQAIRVVASLVNYTFPEHGNVVFVMGNSTVNFVGNQGDLCPNDPNKTNPGFCGCGRDELDADGNGVCDYDQKYSLTGKVKNTGSGSGISGVTLSYVADGYSKTVVTGSNGAYTIGNRPYGESFIITPTKTDYFFTPASFPAIFSANIVKDFVGSQSQVDNCPNDPAKTEPGICGCGNIDVDVNLDGICDTGQAFTISGKIRDVSSGAPLQGVVVEYRSSAQVVGGTSTTNASGDFLFNGIAPGQNYIITPQKAGYIFTPIKKEGQLMNNVIAHFFAQADAVDGCPSDPDKMEPGVCGCGIPDTDSDGDGIYDCDEVQCEGACDANNPNFDEDGDGVSNCQEIEDNTDACDDGSFKERLNPTACAGVNGFLAQANIATVVNQLSTPLRFDVQYRNQFGQLAGQVNFSLLPFQKRDLIVNSMGLEPDTYGTVCVETTAITNGAWSGGITIYKPRFTGANLDEFGDSTVFDYALSIPFSNPIERAIRMPLNTNNVGNTGTAETVSNWVQITDAVVADGAPLRGRLVFYDINGKIVQDKTVKLEDGGRFDFPGHVAIGRNRLGAVEFIPKSKNDKFYFVLIRYYPEDKMNFLSAFVMPIVFPSGAERTGRLSTLSDEVSVIEVINATANEVRSSQSAFGTTGQAIYSDKSIRIAAKGSAHTIINSGVLGFNTIGSAIVSGPRESLTETTIVYRLNNSGALALAYSLPFVQSAGTVQFADFNSFIGHKNFVEVTNTAETKADTAVVNVVDTSGSLLESLDVSLDPNQTKRFELGVPGDKVGTIMLDSGTDNGLILRSFVEKEGQYVIPQTGR